ncbi:MAG TPA: hypothetical protein VIJ57_07535 [Hanamia sp.]
MISKIRLTSLLMAAFPVFGFAQENSPYSRYGIGNVLPVANAANRGMGGISAGYADPTTLNSVNPATYSDLIYSTLDVGVEYDGRNLKQKDPLASYKSNNAIISYMQFGFPLLMGNKKAQESKTAWAMAFGLKPISRINYKVQSSVATTDSANTIYEGSGGVNEAFVGTGIKFKNFSIGFNSGYLFGKKNYDNRLSFKSDTTNDYRTHYGTETNFGGSFLDAGVQYVAKLKKGALRIGAYGTIQRKYHASRNNLVETFDYDPGTGAPQPIDTVSYKGDQKGKVQLPATFGGGLTYSNDHFLIGADYETTQWNKYRFFDEADIVKNSWIAKFGMQYLPASPGVDGYFNYVKYRAGFSIGQDYIYSDKALPVYTVSVGGAFPLKLKHNFYDHQYSIMNLTLEYGNRGNAQNNLTESIYKVCVGFSLSDMWFVRQKFQ